MKFLVTTTFKFPLPSAALPSLMDGLVAWTRKYTQQGKLESTWSLAGRAGGGGIFNVNSLEELDAIMAEYPVWPFSEIQVEPIVELQGSVERVKQALQAMLHAMPKG